MKTALFVLLAFNTYASALITKSDALAMLKSSGIRWKQTELIPVDAELTLTEANAALEPHVALVGREIATRANLQKYGFPDPGPLQVVSFGGTFLEGEVKLFDQTSSYQQQAAEINVNIQKQNRNQYQSDLTFGMFLTYINCQRQYEKVKIYDENIERDREMQTMADSKIKAGLGLVLDQMRAKGLISLDSLRKIDAQAELEKCRKDLANILGLPHIDGELEKLKFSELHIPTSDPFMKTGIEDRADVKSAIFSIDAARKLRQASKAEKMPKIRLLGDIGIGGTNFIPTTGANALGTIGIEISVPLFDGGYFDAKIQQAEISLSKAELQAQQVRIEAEGQIQSAVEKLKTSRAAVNLANEQIDLAKEDLNITRHRFRSGASNAVDYVTSETNLSTALLNQIDVIAANESAKINYYKSISEIEDYVSLPQSNLPKKDEEPKK